MELSGHSPFIVFEDSNIDKVADMAITAKFRNNGQVCISPNRFYIQESKKDEFVTKFIERANDNDLGLCSYIYTNSMEQAHRASELMETGCVAVNTAAVAVAEAPFGGIKQTGYGREGGSMAIKDYLNIKYTHLGLKG